MRTSKYLFRILILIFSAVIVLFSSCEKDDNEPPVNPTDQVSKKIGTEGGEISLSDGIKVIIPAGAMSETKEIKLSKYKPEDFFDGKVDNYYVIGCEPNGLTFSKPVEIYFPVPQVLESGNFDGLAGLLDEESNALEVYPITGITIDGKSMIKIETNHFSKYAGHFWEYPPYESPSLEIPHYNQGSSPYCWAACLQMVCEAVKHDEINEITDIIGYTGISESGLDQYAFRYNSKIASLVKLRTGVIPERQIFPIGSATSLDSYLKDRLALGYPVVVFTPVEEHAFVVIGYKGNTFYINNPASTSYDGQLSYQTKTWADFKVGEMEINAKFVTLSIPTGITCSGRLQSVNLADKGMTFSQVKPAPQAPVNYNFRYNYENTSGYSFKDKDGKVFDTIPGDVTNLELTEIQLSNTSTTQTKSFNIWIDIWGQNNKKLHKSIPPKETVKVAPNSYKVYQISIPVSEFRDSSSTATKYRMQITAVEAGGGVMDDASVFFTINPPPSIMEFKFRMRIKYKDGSSATAGFGVDENEPLIQIPGSWKQNVYTGLIEVTQDGHNATLKIISTCSSDRKTINSFSLDYIYDQQVFMKLRASNLNLVKDNNKYKIDLFGTATCSPIDLNDIKLYSFYSDIDSYYCDESSYFILRLPE